MGRESIGNKKGQQTMYGFEGIENDKRLRRNKPDWDGTPKGNEPKRLWQRSHEVIGMKVTGMPNTEIARVLGITPGAVSTIVNSELGMQLISKMRKERDQNFVEISDKISGLAEQAVAVYKDILTNESVDYKLKKSTADTVLMDIGGHKAPTKIDTENKTLNVYATPAELMEFRERGIKAAKEAGLVVEGNSESSTR